MKESRDQIKELTEERDRLAKQVDELQELFRIDGEQHASVIRDLTNRHETRITKYAERIKELREANAELKPLLQNIGDGIVNMFDQLVRGNWRDDHDHDVKMNVHMLNLQDVLKQIMRFRADYLDYSEPNFDKHKATSTEREGE